MPRFYFDVQDRDGVHRDEFGDDFDDIAEARVQARALLPDIARKEVPSGDEYVVSCDIRDAGGDLVYRGELVFRETKRTAASAHR